LRQQAETALREGFAAGPGDWSQGRATHCAGVSRLVRGFASAYLLSGDERFLAAAEAGTGHLRERFREPGTPFWRGRPGDRGPLALQDQFDALAGPVQLYRATGDRRVLADVEATVAGLDQVFADPVRGGWFSHAGAGGPRDPGLGPDRARKTIGSVGGHVPAYLADLAAATGDERWTRRLADVASTLVRHFGDYENSPFLQERFHEDWTREQDGGPGGRAVAGHDLRTAWSLARIAQSAPHAEYLDFARRIADVLPAAATDLQRGGWYDVLERAKPPNDREFPVLRPDRKSAWSQQQAVLAYLVLAGTLRDERYRRRAREAAAFHNAWLLDHAGGGLHPGVRADGRPDDADPGIEPLVPASDGFGLCFPAAVATALLLAREPLRLWFRPVAADLPGRVLRVAPDLLPPRAARIARVWIEGRATEEFDAEALTVRLPAGSARPAVQVELVPGDGTAAPGRAGADRELPRDRDPDPHPHRDPDRDPVRDVALAGPPSRRSGTGRAVQTA
jgi:mannose/cellobiose epimerase-like protein (N-acyl-D-glucosamine 2-epimerase family)